MRFGLCYWAAVLKENLHHKSGFVRKGEIIGFNTSPTRLNLDLDANRFRLPDVEITRFKLVRVRGVKH